MVSAAPEALSVFPFKLPRERRAFLPNQTGTTAAQDHFRSVVSKAINSSQLSLQEAFESARSLPMASIRKLQNEISLMNFNNGLSGNAFGEFRLHPADCYGGIQVSHVHPKDKIHGAFLENLPNMFTKSEVLGVVSLAPFGQEYPEKGFEQHISNHILFDVLHWAQAVRGNTDTLRCNVFVGVTNPKNARFLHRVLGIQIKSLTYKDEHGKVKVASQGMLDQWINHPQQIKAYEVLMYCTREQVCTSIASEAGRNLEISLKRLRVNEPEEYEKELRLFAMQMQLSNVSPLVKRLFSLLNRIRKANGRTRT